MNELLAEISEAAARGSADLHQLLDVLPAAVYITDAGGVVTYFNRAAAEIAGHTPVLGRDKWCVSWRLYDRQGKLLPLDQCPMAVALKEKRPVHNEEIIIERPDGTRIPAKPYPTPFFDHTGKLTGAINLIIDLRELKKAQRTAEDAQERAETAQRKAEDAGQTAKDRMHEQMALYRFVDEVYRAKSNEDVYEAALDAIAVVMGCRRASILTFDGKGVMRFIAWRGLSDSYRAAVDGHSPWSPTDRDPEPIFVSDIAETDLPDDLKKTIKDENITALAFIPLMAGGKLIGKFMTYHEHRHEFTREERDMAITISRQLGFSLGLISSEKARRIVEDRDRFMGSIVESSDDAIVSKNLNGDILTWNQGAEHLFGYSAEEAIGKNITMLIPDDLLAEETYIIDRIKHGEVVGSYETIRRRKDGGLIDISLTVSPVKNADGVVVGASKIARDISERKRADAHKSLLIHELNHRVKNTLATVQSLAMQTLKNTSRSEDAREIFESRLTALSRAHDVLTDQSWEGANLIEIVSRAMQAFRFSDGRIKFEGPSVWLSPKQTLALSMALHELATNAAKYGSLSNNEGRVKIAWGVLRDKNGHRQLNLAWEETGGPAVVPPARKGFGSRLIERSLANELDGLAALDYRPEGIVCTINSRLD